VIVMTTASIVSVVLIVSVTFALDYHPPRAAFTPATTVLVADHAHVFHAVIDAECHGIKGRGVCAANEQAGSAGHERNYQLAHCGSSQVVGIVAG
jgi:hypothetical protein